MNRQTFLKCALGAMTTLGVSSCLSLVKRSTASVTTSLVAASGMTALVPPALPRKGTIGVIAPAGPFMGTSKTGIANDCATWLRAQGYGAVVFPGVSERNAYLAGTDSRRLKDLQDAFTRTDIHAILCLRGGYGSMRLLDRIDYGLIRQHPKPFVGYSDITVLHGAFARFTGMVTFHGPMMAPDLLAEKLEPTLSALLAMLQGGMRKGMTISHPNTFALITLQAGVASGRLVGGNLAIINALLSTPYDIDTEGAILFIEDVGEPLYRLDRLLTQLRLAGKFTSLRGVLVGDFDKVSIDEFSPLLQQTFGPLKIPVLAGWRSGHCAPNLTLPLGAQVTLDATFKQLRLEQEVVVVN